MLVGIDNLSPGASTGTEGVGGMRHYLQALVEGLPRANPEWKFKLFTPTRIPAFRTEGLTNLEIVACSRVPSNRIGRTLYEQFVLPRLISSHGVDVWLGTCNTLPLRAPCNTALILQSLQYFTNPKAFAWHRRLYLKTVVPRSLGRADIVIALSQASKTELASRFGLADQEVAVVPNCLPSLSSDQAASETDQAVASRVLGQKAPFILCISALYAYKNHARLIEAFARIKDEFPKHRLLIGGGDTPGYGRSDLKIIAERFGVSGRVTLAGRIQAADISALYRAADMMAMPSLDETFGLPILEAMSLDCPVLTSNVSSMAEIGGSAAKLVNPYDVGSIEQGLREMLGNLALRRSLIKLGRERVSLFSKEEMVKKLSSVLARFEKSSFQPENVILNGGHV